jgi:hypothetical protein
MDVRVQEEETEYDSTCRISQNIRDIDGAPGEKQTVLPGARRITLASFDLYSSRHHDKTLQKRRADGKEGKVFCFISLMRTFF